MAEVVLENVSRVYPGGTRAVDSISLEVRDRELMVLVGPSGCGKSTTLRMIAGLEAPTSGEIRIGGRSVTGVPPRDRNIAMVFQNYALYPHMTVRKNMAFGLELRYGGSLPIRAWRRVFRPRQAAVLSAKRREIDGQVRWAAETLGIERLLDRMPRQLSGGERQRVALGRAIVRQPAAFLFDEPLSNLDAKLRVGMRRELKLLHERLAATMLYVTHDQVEALTLGDRVAVMDRGAVQQVGPAIEVYDKPRNRFVAGFIGTPPMNFLTGELTQENGRVEFRGPAAHVVIDDSIAGRLPKAGRGEVTLGVRPENVTPADDGVAARVAVVEPLGDASLVHLELPGGPAAGEPTTIVSKVDARAAFRSGEAIRVEFDPRRIHLFDAQTGESLID